MHRWFHNTLVALLLASSLALPLSASALGFSFGGRVVSAPVPCTGLPGFFGFAIAPAGLFSPLYVWGPGTIGPPPYRVGQFILGLYDTVLTCNGAPAFRVQYDGISI